MEKPSAHKIIKKIDRVYASCKTKEHFEVAEKFMRLALERYGQWEKFTQFVYLGDGLRWDMKPNNQSHLIIEREHEEAHVEIVLTSQGPIKRVVSYV